MAEDAPNHLITLLEIPAKHRQLLDQIRHWANLKIAADKDNIWIKDFTETQLESVELKAIPFTQLYVVKENLLFPKGSLLPIGKLPQLLWTPIERALPIELPNLNHNYFGLNEKVTIKLVASETEQQATAILIDIVKADSYMQIAPAIRLKNIVWTIMENNKVLLIGSPLLPLNGTSFWQKNDFIFPIGFDLEFSFLENEIIKAMNPESFNYIFWLDDINYCLIPKDSFSKLSIASWRVNSPTSFSR